MKDIRYTFRRISLWISKTHIQVLQHELNLLLASAPGKNISVLDLGAGSGWYWDELEINTSNGNVKVTLFDATASIPKERHGNIEFVRVNGFVPLDLVNFPSDSFDLVVAFDLIEHLSKEDGYRLLYELDRLAKFSSIIFTPNGFIWQPPALNNEFNAHISGWSPKILKQNGWKFQLGHAGFRKFRGPYGSKSPWIRGTISCELDAIAQILTFNRPRISFAFSAIKRKKNLRMENQEL